MGQVGNVSFSKIAPTGSPNAALFFNAVISALGFITLLSTANDIQRRVVFVSSNAGDTNQVLQIIGTNQGGSTISESVTLNGVTPVPTKFDYLNITSIRLVSGTAPTAGTISIGQNQTISSPWVVTDIDIANYNIGLFAHVIGGTITYSVEETMDDPNADNSLAQGFVGTGFQASLAPDSYSPPIAIADLSSGTITAKSADATGILTFPVFAYRLTVTAYTFSAGVGVSLQGIQAGLHN